MLFGDASGTLLVGLRLVLLGVWCSLFVVRCWLLDAWCSAIGVWRVSFVACSSFFVVVRRRVLFACCLMVVDCCVSLLVVWCLSVVCYVLLFVG